MVFHQELKGNNEVLRANIDFQVGWNWKPPQSYMRLQHTNTNSEQPLTVTIRAAALRLSISQMTVRRLMASGALERIRFGRSVRVTAASVIELVAKGGDRRGK